MNYAQWSARFNELQAYLDREDVASARPLLEFLDSERAGLAAEGLDLAEVARGLLACCRSHIARSERRYDDALRLAREAEPTIPLGASENLLVNANVQMAFGNVYLLRGDPDEAMAHYSAAVRDARRGGFAAVAANALFNVGTCLMLLRREGEAIAAFEEAGRYYSAVGREDKIADVYHQVGNAFRSLDDLEKAGGCGLEAFRRYTQQKDLMGCWRSADDLTRVFIEKSANLEREGKEDQAEVWAQKALDYALVAAASARDVWRRDHSDERLADLSEEFLNHTVTLLEVSLRFGNLLLFMGALAAYKGRIRARSLPQLAGRVLGIDDELASSVADDLLPAVAEASLRAAAALRRENTPAVAVVDQMAIPGGRMLMGVATCADTARIEWVESALVTDSRKAKPRTVRASPHRAADAEEVVARLNEKMHAHSGRCCYLLGRSEEANDAQDRDQLRAWSEELAEQLGILGRWFFPKELLEELEATKAAHVVLVPDPLFTTLPYLALETDRGAVVDQPWSLSIATTAVDLVRVAVRKSSLSGPSAIVWAGPDATVNADGGDEEKRAIESLFAVEPLVGMEATVERVSSALRAGRWIHFRGHGFWSGDIRTSGPLLAHEQVLSRAVLEQVDGLPNYVVTAACRTGFAEGIGSEILGSLADYDRANAYGCVLTSWPIHGPFATAFMRRFYRHLAEKLDVAVALKRAAIESRDGAPHPYLWAAFLAWGGWDVSQFLAPITASSTGGA